MSLLDPGNRAYLVESQGLDQRSQKRVSRLPMSRIYRLPYQPPGCLAQGKERRLVSSCYTLLTYERGGTCCTNRNVSGRSATKVWMPNVTWNQAQIFDHTTRPPVQAHLFVLGKNTWRPRYIPQLGQAWCESRGLLQFGQATNCGKSR